MWNGNKEQKRDSEPRNYSPPQHCLNDYYQFQSGHIHNEIIVNNNVNSNNFEIPHLERINFSESEQNNEIFDINQVDKDLINNDIREKKINLEIHKGFRKTLFGIPKQIKDDFDLNKVNRLKDQLRIKEEIISKYQKQLKEKDLLISNFQKTIEKYKYLLEINDIVDTIANPQKYSNYEEDPKPKEVKNKIDNNVDNFTVNKNRNFVRAFHKNYQKIDKEKKEDMSTFNKLSILLQDQRKIISQQSNKKKTAYSIMNDMNNYEFDDEQYLSKVKQKKQKLNAQEIKAMQLPGVDNMSYEELLSLENQIGNVNRGLSKHQIKMLPQITFKNCLSFNNQTNCLICQENFVEQEKLRKFNCGHIFHIECVDQWLENEKTCPTCKKSVI